MFPHIVRDDETVDDLMRGYLVTFEQLKRYNPDLTRGKLKLGSVILIPPFD